MKNNNGLNRIYGLNWALFNQIPCIIACYNWDTDYNDVAYPQMNSSDDFKHVAIPFRIYGQVRFECVMEFIPPLLLPETILSPHCWVNLYDYNIRL